MCWATWCDEQAVCARAQVNQDRQGCDVKYQLGILGHISPACPSPDVIFHLGRVCFIRPLVGSFYARQVSWRRVPNFQEGLNIDTESYYVLYC